MAIWAGVNIATFLSVISLILSALACYYAYKSTKLFNDSLKIDFNNKKPILCVHQGRIQNDVFSFDFKNFGNRIAKDIRINISLLKIINNEQVLLLKFEPPLFQNELIPFQESLISCSSGNLVLESDFFIKLHFTYLDSGDNSQNENEYFFKVLLNAKQGYNIFNLNESEMNLIKTIKK